MHTRLENFIWASPSTWKNGANKADSSDLGCGCFSITGVPGPWLSPESSALLPSHLSGIPFLHYPNSPSSLCLHLGKWELIKKKSHMRANCYHYEFQHSLDSQGCLAILLYLPSQLSLLCSTGLFLKLPPLSPCSVEASCLLPRHLLTHLHLH